MSRGADGIAAAADRSTARLDALRVGLGVAAAAAGTWATGVAAAGEDARKAIVHATGASGAALSELEADYREIAGGSIGPFRTASEEAAAAVGALNTHTGQSGPRLVALSRAVIDAGLDADKFGQALRRGQVAADDQVRAVDELVVLGQVYGADLDTIVSKSGRYADRLEDLNLSLTEQHTLVALSESEGRRLSSVIEELEEGTGGWDDKLADAVAGLGDAEGATARMTAEGRTLTDRLTLVKNGLASMIDVSPGVVTALGASVTAATQMSVVFPGAASAVSVAARTMWAAITGPVGIAVAVGAAIAGVLYVARDKVAEVIAWLVDLVGGAAEWLGLDGIAEWAEESSGKLRDWAEDVRDGGAAAGEFVGPVADVSEEVGGTDGLTDRIAAGRAELQGAEEDTRDWLKELQALETELSTNSNATLVELAQNLEDVEGTMDVLAVSRVPDAHTALMMALPQWVEGLEDVEEAARPAADIPGEWESAAKDARDKLAEVWTPENVGGIIASAFVAGSGITGAAQALGTHMGSILADNLGTKLADKLGGVLGGALSAVLPGVGGLIGSFAGQAVSWVAGIFADENADLEAHWEAYRETWRQQWTSGPGEWGDETAGDWVDRLVGDDWDRELAEFRVAIGGVYRQAGKSQEEASRDVGEYWQAVHDNNQGAVLRFEQLWDSMREEQARDVLATDTEIAESGENLSNVLIGQQVLAGHTVESLELLRESALETFDQAGGAAETFADRLVAALDRGELRVVELGAAGAAFVAGLRDTLAEGAAVTDAFVDRVVASLERIPREIVIRVREEWEGSRRAFQDARRDREAELRRESRRPARVVLEDGTSLARGVIRNLGRAGRSEGIGL